MNSKDSIPVFQNPQLDGKTKFLEGKKDAGLLLIHGFTATTVEVSWLASYFHQMGYSVATPLLPGHGTSPEDLNKTRYQDWIITVEESYQKLTKSCQKVIVGGESMGAVLSLYLAAIHDEIAALLLYSPALKVDQLGYSRFLRFFKSVLPKKNYDDGMPWQGYTVYPLNAAFEFYKLQRMTQSKISKVKSPTIIFHGAHDQTIDKDVSEFIYHAIASPVKKILKLNNSGHVMLLDKEIELIVEETWKFLQSNKIF